MSTVTWNDTVCPDFSYCPVCGDIIDYCQGHGEIGDPVGFARMQAHDNGDHTSCVIVCDED